MNHCFFIFLKKATHLYNNNNVSAFHFQIAARVSGLGPACKIIKEIDMDIVSYAALAITAYFVFDLARALTQGFPI